MTKFLARVILQLIPWTNHSSSKNRVALVWIAEIAIFAFVFPLFFRWLGLRMEHLIISSNFFVQMFQRMGHNIHVILATSPASSILGGLLLGCGLFLWAWASYCQWTYGMGTWVLATPTVRLVVKGPYRFIRNPIQLSTMLIYAGVGLLQHSYCIALVSLVVYGSAGSWYNMKLEEKELLARFGEEYHRYRDQVPFLIPRFWNGKFNKVSRKKRSK